MGRKLQGGAGPGGKTAMQWQDFLLRYGAPSERLRDGIAELTRRLANNIVDWMDIRALMADRLIAFNKNPGVHPIGIGEVLRRILGKVIAAVTQVDVESVCGVDQLCSGLKAGIEGAIHSTRELFEEKSGDGFGLLLVDANNAFNSVNRAVALWNVRVLWPRCSRFLFNTYQGYSTLWVSGCSDRILSKEGVTQGDLLSMLLYAIAVLPLIRSLSDKTVLVVDTSYETEATSMFGSLGIKVVLGQRFLGSFVGDQHSTEAFINQKVQSWVQCIEKLSKAAESQPQAAYAALSKSLQFEWTYLQWVLPDCANHVSPLRDIINESFWTSLFGCSVSVEESELFFLPTYMAGLGVRDPVVMALIHICHLKLARPE